MVRETKARACGEIGCHVGFSTLFVARALEQNALGRLWAFDLDTSRAATNLADAGLGEFVTFCHGPSGEKVARALGERAVSFAFIDGDHTRRGGAEDRVALFPCLRQGSVVVLHDIYARRCGWFGPRLLLEAMARASDGGGFALFEVEERSDLDLFGLAICRLAKTGRNPLERIPRWQLRALAAPTLAWVENACFIARAEPSRQALARRIWRGMGRRAKRWVSR